MATPRSLSLVAVAVLAFSLLAATPAPPRMPRATRTPTPAPGQQTAGMRLLFRDDFSKPDSRWSPYNEEDGYSSLENGALGLTITQEDNYVWSTVDQRLDDVSMELDAQADGVDRGLFGAICRYQDGSNFYALTFNVDRLSYGVLKVRDNALLPIGRQFSAVSEPAPRYHLRADCVGPNLTLYVNGRKAAEASDPDWTEGRVGVFAATLGQIDLMASFDSFLVLGAPGRSIRSTEAVHEWASQVLLEEDFSTQDPIWFAQTADEDVVEFKDEGYHFRIGQPETGRRVRRKDIIRSDVAIEADVSRIAGTGTNYAGLVCRDSVDSFYSFDVYSDGYYMIARSKNDEFSVLADGRNKAIKTGKAVNRVRAECQGDRLALFVNGTTIAEAHDAELGTGFPGLEAGAGKQARGVEFRFDNLLIQTLP